MLWLIGGTQESGEIGAAIASISLPCMVTVATEAAKSLYPPHLPVLARRLQRDEMAAFVRDRSVAAVVDASHPFAVEVSQNAIAVCNANNIPYLRYERPPSSPTVRERAHCNAIELPSFDALLAGNYLENQRVLLTVGCNPLPQFKPWQNRATLFARILPAVNSLKIALDAGFAPDRAIALRPPISPQLEAALWQHWQISVVVTKASGKAGGEDTKRAVAAQLGVPLIAIARPAIAYPQQTSDLNAIITFCCQFLKSQD
ncbi:MAG: cobalt-precorrin-6A reductase [Cyanobacteriota bacterium]|nr:cobalt-precorrin-6A reductase [Cyanobacteriota bacterium]